MDMYFLLSLNFQYQMLIDLIYNFNDATDISKIGIMVIEFELSSDDIGNINNILNRGRSDSDVHNMNINIRKNNYHYYFHNSS